MGCGSSRPAFHQQKIMEPGAVEISDQALWQLIQPKFKVSVLFNRLKMKRTIKQRNISYQTAQQIRN